MCLRRVEVGGEVVHEGVTIGPGEGINAVGHHLNQYVMVPLRTGAMSGQDVPREGEPGLDEERMGLRIEGLRDGENLPRGLCAAP